MRVWKCLHRFVLLAPITLLLACSAHRQPAPAPAEAEPVVLRAGDAVRLAVRDEPELADDYPVGADGTVLLPLVGLERVAGEPFDEVAARVRAAYARELPHPELVIVPLMRVAVTGEARTPGVFVVDPTYMWSDVLAQAGGVAPTAARGRLVLVRDGIEYELEVDGANGMGPVAVRSGDMLVVPRRSWIEDNMPALIGSATAVLVAAVTALLVR